MAKKQKAESIHDRDRIIVRLPDGMRDDLAALAEANGRSMTSEVVAAIERHLKGVDRVAQLWEFFEQNRQQIEEFAFVRTAVENLEIFAERSGDFRGGLRERRQKKEDDYDAVTDVMRSFDPPITAEQAQRIRALLSDTGASESFLLTKLGVTSIEEISSPVAFKRALSILEMYRREKKGRPA